MADEKYDIEAARVRHNYIMQDMVNVKNILKKEIDYYFDRSPQSVDEELEQQRILKIALGKAAEGIHAILNGKSINW